MNGDAEMVRVTHSFKALGYPGEERHQAVGEECGVAGGFISKMGNDAEMQMKRRWERGRGGEKWKFPSSSSLSPTSNNKESLFCSGTVLIVRHYFFTLSQNLSATSPSSEREFSPVVPSAA